MTKYTVKPTMQFKKDYKLAIKRGVKIERLEEIISSLANGVPLPEKNKDHALGGSWSGHRECHILTIMPMFQLCRQMKTHCILLEFLAKKSAFPIMIYQNN